MTTETAPARTCSVALKEWSVTCLALREGRQIALLRKGGLQDEDGVFSVEHDRFWLMPTYLHQEKKLVRPPHHDLFARAEAERLAGENKKLIALRLLAEVTQVYEITPERSAPLAAAPHIWSEEYLDTRFDYRPDKPLLCVLLRVFTLDEPHILPFRAEYFGCRSWLDLPAPLPAASARPVLDDASFAAALRAWRELFR
jgi:hypothetical protein